MFARSFTRFAFLCVCFVGGLYGPLSGQTLRVGYMQTGQLQPVEGALVQLRSLHADSTHSTKWLITDARGEASLTLDAPHLVRVERMGFHPLIDTLHPDKQARPLLLQPQAVALPEVVTVGQYVRGTADEAVQKIRVLDRKRIEAQGAANLQELLGQELNIRLTQDNILGTGLQMQGLPGQNVKILVDGVPVIGRLDGNIDLTQINLNDIERIEIVEGPMSVSYGTDALGGVINLITRKETRHRIRGGINLQYESLGDYNVDGFAGGRFGKHGFRVSGGRNFFDGWSPASSDRERGSQWKPREQIFSHLDYDLRLGKVQLRSQVRHFDETLFNFGEPQITSWYARARDELFHTRRTQGQVGVRTPLGRYFHLDALASFSRYEREREVLLKDLVALESELQTTGDALDTLRQSLGLTRGTLSYRNPQRRLGFQVGWDVNLEQGSGGRIRTDAGRIGDYALFGSVEYRPVKQLVLRPALRVAYNTVYDVPLIPSVSARWALNRTWTIRGSWARGFRAPGVKELYFFFVDVNHNIRGNENLSAETSHNLHLHAVGTWVGKKHLFRIEPSLFYNTITDWIQLALVDAESGLYQYVNISEYSTHGLMLNGQWKTERVDLQLGGSVIGRSHLGGDVEGVPAYGYAPEIRIQAAYSFPKPGIQCSAFYKYTGRLPNYWIETDNEAPGGQRVVEGFMEDYHTLDLTTSKSFWNRRAVLTLGVRNLFDVTNIVGQQQGSAHSSGSGMVPVAAGRTFFCSLSLQLWKKLTGQ